MPPLTVQHAQIFRITHVNNVPFILDNGIHCRSGSVHDPKFTPIGLPDLINKRAPLPIPCGPGGTLSDYIPFYFTPRSIMLFNIKTGYGEVVQRENREIAIMVSSLPRLTQHGVRFVFTNGHASLAETDFFDDTKHLGKIDWKILQNRDFKRDDRDPGKKGRYQAEALAYQHVPVSALSGIACYDEPTRARLAGEAARRRLALPVKALRDWYF